MKRPATYFTPTDDVRKKLNPQSRFFSTIDLSSGYHQVELSEEDRRITTFLTPFGKFRFKRLPMGLSPSGDYFNIRTQNLISGLKGVHKSIDDMLVEAVTRKELFNTLFKLLTACKENGVT